jgi:16S rRNA processing protein RimM
MKLNVGRIGKAHGVLGEATIEVRTDDAAHRFAIGAVVETENNGILLLGFEGINDRNGIETLRDQLLYADVDINAPGEDQDDYHVMQLIGCATFLESGEPFGEVTDVLNLPGQDVLVIKRFDDEILIPFVHQLVPTVDISHKRMTVIPPDISGELR